MRYIKGIVIILEALAARKFSEMHAFVTSSSCEALVSASGTTNAVVWAHENTPPAVLHAYDASNLAQELYNSNQAAGGRDQFGPGNKFIAPTVAGGKVFVGTTNTLAIFGLLQ
jgi:hypothetical protein